jgi:hypothetical protein
MTRERISMTAHRPAYIAGSGGFPPPVRPRIAQQNLCLLKNLQTKLQTNSAAQSDTGHH